MSNASEKAISISILRGTAQTPGGSVALTRRDLELVVLMSADGRCISSHRLADALWPDADPADAENSAYVAVHRLRRRLRDPGCIVRERFGYRLGAHVGCDLHRIESAVEALVRRPLVDEDEKALLDDAYAELSRSPWSPGAGTCVPAAVEARIARLLHSIDEAAARCDLARGAFARALDRAVRAIERDACDESALEIAIRAHLAMRNRAKAMLAYRTYASALERELDLKPSASLRELLAS